MSRYVSPSKYYQSVAYLNDIITPSRECVDAIKDRVIVHAPVSFRFNADGYARDLQLICPK